MQTGSTADRGKGEDKSAAEGKAAEKGGKRGKDATPKLQGFQVLLGALATGVISGRRTVVGCFVVFCCVCIWCGSLVPYATEQPQIVRHLGLTGFAI